jgi:hypothetical protein
LGGHDQEKEIKNEEKKYFYPREEKTKSPAVHGGFKIGAYNQ